MTARRPLPPGWQGKEVAAFVLAVEKARQIVRGGQLAPRPTPPVRGLLSSFSSDTRTEEAERKSASEFDRGIKEARRRAMADVERHGFYCKLNADINFQKLHKRLAGCIGDDFDDHLRVLRAVALGGMISGAPPKSADKDARASAATAARKLKKLKARGIRLQSYSGDEKLWRLLDDLIREMDSPQRKPRDDDRAGVRAALSFFAAELFEIIGPDQVQAVMLVEFAAVLDDHSPREAEKQFDKEKRAYLKRNRPARVQPVVRRRGNTPKSARFRTH